MNDVRISPVADFHPLEARLRAQRWRVERDAAGARAWLSPPDWPTGDATIEEVRDPADGTMTYTVSLERLATPRLLVSHAGMPTLEAALSWIQGERFLLREHAGVTWVADANSDANWYAQIGDDRFVIERFLERDGRSTYQVVRFPCGTRASAVVLTAGIASIGSFEQAAAVAADFEACSNVRLSVPGRATPRKVAHA
ncbi:hypothetical protein [Burkholderia sp. 22PA0106]|uniref:hypothetical protein n=1 Tax=Burkholderia sp. 22PA0106 TaxID=3237371 RepID=UPI0039C13A43